MGEGQRPRGAGSSRARALRPGPARRLDAGNGWSRGDGPAEGEAVAAQAEAAASMQLPENKDFHQYRKLLEIVLFLPSRAFHLQHEQNKKDTAMKKLVTEIIDGTKTEEAAMELENEAAANMEQLQDLIRKESDKRDKKYKDLEQKYSALQKEMKALSQQKTPAKNDHTGGRPSAPTNQRNPGNRRRNDNRNASQVRSSLNSQRKMTDAINRPISRLENSRSSGN